MADIVTPNLKEASALLGGVPLETIADMRSAAKAIHDIGPRLIFEIFLSNSEIDILTLYYLWTKSIAGKNIVHSYHLQEGTKYLLNQSNHHLLYNVTPPLVHFLYANPTSPSFSTLFYRYVEV